MSRFQRLVDGWNTYQASRIFRRGMRKVNRCLRCDPTARAIRHVQALWVVGGIDLGE